MKKIAIVFGSTTDNTKNMATAISSKLTGEDVILIDAAQLNAAIIEPFPNLILGTSTWGFGDLQDDWDGHLSVLTNSNLSGKTIALFGLGDSGGYPDTFVDGMGILYESIQNKGGKIIGEVSTAGYHFDQSRAVQNDHFVGLPLDEDNESNLSEERIDKWLSVILPQFTE